MTAGAPTDDRFRIVVLGGGTAGWMTAAALVRQLPEARYRIVLIESDAIGTVGVGEATLPHIKLFNDMLGLDEAQFMRATRATFKLGIAFRDWYRAGDDYIHPFGAFGEPWGGVAFQHHWLRMKASGTPVAPIEAYSFAVAAARAGVFELPNEDPSSIRSTYSYAYHFDSGRYAQLLRDWAMTRGVVRREGEVVRVRRDDASGDVRALTLTDGSAIEGDVFVDCSGFRSLLLGQTLGVPFEDWRQWLPCDRAYAVPCAAGPTPLPYTIATARPAGWQWRIPLQHRTGNGHIFSSDFMTDAHACDLLSAGLDGTALGEPRLLRFTPGRRTDAWRGNCVAIGLAAGFLEPLESTSIYLIQAAALDLVRLMPNGKRGVPIDPRLAAEFNRLNALQYDRVRDFLVLHYVANARIGEPMWDYLRAMPLPDTLVHKLALFRARAAAPDYALGLFSRDSWLAVLLGQGVDPAGYDPLADVLDAETVAERLEDFRERIDSAVARMPTHAAFLAGYGAGEDAA